MKYITLIGFCLLLFWANGSENNLNADQAVVSSNIELAFRKGDPEHLLNVMAEEIELGIDAEQVEFNRIKNGHAELILESFFQKYPPISFKYIQEGGTQSTTLYSVGTYESTSQSFKVYLLVKKDKNKEYKLTTLQIKES
ncbi:DUF4783 domain-containing protein [Jiulongibacter sp. NS-SX5]|uniref:DUF4783 domain-containing protein n=1 Tax=Jiulongibacter sp. NS-SX5 TaxID=3463854 RepID=UPI0040584782